MKVKVLELIPSAKKNFPGHCLIPSQLSGAQTMSLLWQRETGLP